MRSRGEELDAVDALVAAVRHVGLDVLVEATDILVKVPGAETLAVAVRAASLVTVDSAPGQVRRWSSGIRAGAAPLVVAKRITADGRRELDQAGWSWLDLRGHLKLVAPGLFVDADVPALSDQRAAGRGLSGQVGIELATFLLLDPTARVGVRAAASALGRAASSVSHAFAALRADGLVDENRAPNVPDLFWELAELWKPISQDVASIPEPRESRDGSVLHLGLDDIESTVGWALTDTMAAVRYGAPVSVRADHPPDFYVPNQGVMRSATRLLGTATAPSERAGRLRVAPTSLVCAQRVDGMALANDLWPLANPLFVALDLARDPGRGREILDMWTPGRPWHRVW